MTQLFFCSCCPSTSSISSSSVSFTADRCRCCASEFKRHRKSHFTKRTTSLKSVDDDFISEKITFNFLNGSLFLLKLSECPFIFSFVASVLPVLAFLSFCRLFFRVSHRLTDLADLLILCLSAYLSVSPKPKASPSNP